MTIAAASPVIATDLNAIILTQLGAIQADNALAPGGIELNLTFNNLVASTSVERRKCVFVVPCDCYVTSIVTQTGDFTASSTVTVAITADGALVNWPMTVTGTVAAGISRLGRLLFDNTKTSPKSFATTSRAFRALTRGSTVTVIVSTTSVAVPSVLTVNLVMREFFSRA